VNVLILWQMLAGLTEAACLFDDGGQGNLIPRASPSHGLSLDLTLVLGNMQLIIAIVLRGSIVLSKGPQSYAILSLGAQCMVCLLLWVRLS
jgi:hypothetical protein